MTSMPNLLSRLRPRYPGHWIPIESALCNQVRGTTVRRSVHQIQPWTKFGGKHLTVWSTSKAYTACGKRGWNGRQNIDPLLSPSTRAEVLVLRFCTPASQMYLYYMIVIAWPIKINKTPKINPVIKHICGGNIHVSIKTTAFRHILL